MDTTDNKQLVGSRGDMVVVLNPPRGPLSKDDALMFAAWLVVLAGKSLDEFREAFDAVCNT